MVTNRKIGFRLAAWTFGAVRRMILGLSLSGAATHADVIYVDAAATGSGDGTSWVSAYRHLSSAIAASGGSDEIWVARGTYVPDESPAFPGGSGDRAASFHLQGDRKLLGGFAGTESSADQRDPATNQTVLSGRLNSFHVVRTAGSGISARIDGFVITGGNASVFSHNDSGAGILGRGTSLPSGLATVRNCRIQLNFATEDGAGVEGHAGPFVHCTFSENNAGDFGGALANVSGPLVNCVIADNWAYVGSAIAGCSGSIRNCLIIRNRSDLGTISACSGAIQNCTFNGNHAGAGGVLRFCSGPISNCVLFGNQVDWLELSSTPNYSCIQGGSPGLGNIASDPLFVDVDGPDNDPLTWQDNDYRLSLASPCIDSGDSLSLPVDMFDVDDDGDVAELLPIDFATAGRRAQIPSRPDSGVGPAPIVDMGAFEARCPGDIDGNGTAGLEDLAVILTNFGRNDALGVDGDITGDGKVDLADLATLLAVFGSSC